MYTYDTRGNQLGTDGTRVICNQTASFTLSVSADVPGGAASIKVCLGGGNHADPACKVYSRP